MRRFTLSLALLCTVVLSVQLAAADVPYTLSLKPIEIAGLPGLHSYALASYGGKVVVVGGRTNGLHNFPSSAKEEPAFPTKQANDVIYVVDLAGGKLTGQKTTRNLPDALAKHLRATNAQYAQEGDWLYIVGGYGESSEDPTLVTLPYVTALYLPQLIKTVEDPQGNLDAAYAQAYIGFNSQFAPARVTGGGVEPIFDRKTHQRLQGYYLMVFGQTFDGAYTGNGQGFTQVYKNQVRTFQMSAALGAAGQPVQLTLVDGQQNPPETSAALLPPDNPYHRRDLTIAPAIRPNGDWTVAAYGGVFKNDLDGFLTPIYVEVGGHSAIMDEDKNAFQLLSQYKCAVIQAYDSTAHTMYSTFYGGISAYYWNGAALVHDPVQLPQNKDGLPFINSISTLKVAPCQALTTMTNQYLHVGDSFPPANNLGSCGTTAAAYGGAETHFVTAAGVPTHENGVLKLEALTAKQTIGYLFAGMLSTAPYSPNHQTCASNQVFEVVLDPTTPTNTIRLEKPADP